MAADAQGSDPLNQQLEDAQLELQHLQELIAQVPELMEKRFRRELHEVVAMNQRLLDEQHELLMQLEPAHHLALPQSPMPWFRQALRLDQRWLTIGLALAGVVSVAVAITTIRLPVPVPSRSLPKVASPTPPTRRSPSPLSRNLSVAGTEMSLLELQARSPTWVQINNRGGELLMKDTFAMSGNPPIRLRNGLRLIAARPEVLLFRVDGGPWQAWPKDALRSGVLDLVPAHLH
ncbi:MAG: hypothetical protein FJ077_01950 [Cyanobacteria bacterium K_DeepCast_35m_m2_023]|nr:hypothetical protein [Cyanobacteria bacterium K_DeepCast_35m_m2_023]